MVHSKKEFKKLWEANEEGSGITFEDIADCAKAWGLYSKPRIHPIFEVRDNVLKTANCIE